MSKKYVVLSHMGDDVTVEFSSFSLEDASDYKDDLEVRNEDNPEVYFTIEEVDEIETRSYTNE